MILASDFVQSTEVHTKSQGTVFLLSKENWGSGRGIRRTNEAFLQVVFNVILEGS